MSSLGILFDKSFTNSTKRLLCIPTAKHNKLTNIWVTKTIPITSFSELIFLNP